MRGGPAGSETRALAVEDVGPPAPLRERLSCCFMARGPERNDAVGEVTDRKCH